ncbi:hypothetical protein M0R45_013010 [Rubus argutus]|uniref:Uncharacterized protein n=1 Tax=Rubus argutus TaxID=59490 RepID=A0AAW1XGX1_RUBAR
MASLNQNGGDFEFTKELVQALMHEKFGDKANGKELAEYVKDLKDCTMKWYEETEKAHFLEEKRLQTFLDFTKKKGE